MLWECSTSTQGQTVNTNNIEADKKNNFRRYKTTQLNTYNVPYDYTSIMHYGSKVSHRIEQVENVKNIPNMQFSNGEVYPV